jgi:phosphoribosylformylglycinamidine synthase PurS subunit
MPSMKARVFVTLKPSVLDPQGQAVAHSLGRMGFAEVKDARIGKYIEIELTPADGAESVEAARARVDAMCRELLANPVIEEYRFELVDERSSSGTGSPKPKERQG